MNMFSYAIVGFDLIVGLNAWSWNTWDFNNYIKYEYNSKMFFLDWAIQEESKMSKTTADRS
jgi:hypothetical protein